MFQLRRIEVVVFDGIPRPVDLSIAQSRNPVYGLQLDLPWHARREAIEIHFIRVRTLRFEEERMRMLVREGNEFRLYGRAVAWPCTLNLSVEEGRVCQSATQHLVYLLVCVAGPAGKLRKLPVWTEERELVIIRLSRLRFHLVEVY